MKQHPILILVIAVLLGTVVSADVLAFIQRGLAPKERMNNPGVVCPITHIPSPGWWPH